MRKRRWPENAEERRLAAVQSNREVRRLITEARRLVKVDPVLVGMLLADAGALAADTENHLVLARWNEGLGED